MKIVMSGDDFHGEASPATVDHQFGRVVPFGLLDWQ
jgi:hypothetical protein